jgi:hypothetical protein
MERRREKGIKSMISSSSTSSVSTGSPFHSPTQKNSLAPAKWSEKEKLDNGWMNRAKSEAIDEERLFLIIVFENKFSIINWRLKSENRHRRT